MWSLSGSSQKRVLIVDLCSKDLESSTALAMLRDKNDESMSKPNEPSDESLAEMPEVIDDQRFQRRSGRGHHAHRRVGEIVTIDADLGGTSVRPRP